MKPRFRPLKFGWQVSINTPDGEYIAVGPTWRDAWDELLCLLKCVGLYWEVFPDGAPFL